MTILLVLVSFAGSARCINKLPSLAVAILL
jgi:hypothetical protein